MRARRLRPAARLLLYLFLATALGASAACGQRALTVGAAASLTDVFVELAALATERGTGRVRVSTASSGTLEAQLRAGAPLDLLASASVLEPERLYAAGVAYTPVEFARNGLVVAVRSGLAPPDTIDDLRRADLGRIAIGDPAIVPSGRYAEQTLRAAGLWEVVQERLIPCENVRQALVYLERGEVDAAFLYATDVSGADSTLAEWEVPDSLHSPIRYLACISRETRRADAARAFLELLLSAEGQSILRAHGFRPPLPASQP